MCCLMPALRSLDVSSTSYSRPGQSVDCVVVEVVVVSGCLNADEAFGLNFSCGGSVLD